METHTHLHHQVKKGTYWQLLSGGSIIYSFQISILSRQKTKLFDFAIKNNKTTQSKNLTARINDFGYYWNKSAVTKPVLYFYTNALRFLTILILSCDISKLYPTLCDLRCAVYVLVQ